MNTKLNKFYAGVLCLASLTTPAFAGYGNPPPVIVSSPASPPPVVVNNGTPIRHHNRHHSGSVSVSINMPEPAAAPVYYRGTRRADYYRPHQPAWIALHAGEPIPANSVIGGSRFSPNEMFYVCRAYYRGGIHPGKYMNGNCHISFNGRSVIQQNYEVLVSYKPLTWVESSAGEIPRHAIAGGRSAKGEPYYICQADYENGTYPGKLIGNNCHFTKGGEEFMTAYYNVLAS